jgi:hypothetical protein
MGVSFAEVGGILAGMSKTGTDASTAVTQLRQIMSSILKPTAEANRTLESLGLSAEGLRQQIREKGLFNTLETLNDAFAGNEEITAKVFGNVRALSGVFDLLGPSLEDNREIVRLMTDDIGVLDEAFGIVEETVKFKFDKAMATAKDGLLGIGLAIVERLQPHLDTFLGWLETNGPAIEQGFIDIFNGIDDFVSSQIMADMMQSFRDTLPHIEDMVSSLGELSNDLLPILPGAIDLVTGAIRLLSDVVAGVADGLSAMNEELHDYGILSEDVPTITEKNREAFRKFDDVIASLRDNFQKFLRDINAPFESLNAPVRGADLLRPSGRRASGGPVSSGRSYLVGEMGPEIFTPSAGGGNITPNSAMGGAVYNITVNAGMGAGDGARLGEQIVSAIRRYERSSGKVFADRKSTRLNSSH